MTCTKLSNNFTLFRQTPRRNFTINVRTFDIFASSRALPKPGNPFDRGLRIPESFTLLQASKYLCPCPMLSCERKVLRVLVVDDHELTRFSLKLALQSQSGIELVGLASNGREAVEMATRYSPDVIILDLQMPVMDGLSASSEIKTMHPNTRILAYSSLEDPQTEVMLQTAKVDAFCKKDTAIKDLIAMVNKLGHHAGNSAG